MGEDGWLCHAEGQFHRQVAYQMVFWSMVHATAHYVNFINVGADSPRRQTDPQVERTQVRRQTAAEIHYTQAGGITGHAWVKSENYALTHVLSMLLIMFLMYTTAHAKIRQQCFEAFWYTHHLASRALGYAP
jgi:NADPH oxidase